MFRAICFAVECCGFTPRCALERADSSEVRYEKICRLISRCHLAIHDISRTQIDPGSRLPRLNMAFELGLYLGCKRFGCRAHAGKRALILDCEPHRYRRFLSDLGGHDPQSHDGRPAATIACIRNWLNGAGTEPLPGAAHLEELYSLFRHDLPAIAAARRCEPDLLSFEDLTYFIRLWIQEMDASLPDR